MTAPRANSALRERVGAALRKAVDYQIIAEWICCDPVRPDHDMCSRADAMREAMRQLLTDDPDPDGLLDLNSKVLDAVMNALEASD